MRGHPFAAALLSLLCARSVQAEGIGRGLFRWDELAQKAAELQRAPEAVSVECRAVSVHEVSSPLRQGAAKILFALSDASAPIYAVALDRGPRTSRRTWSILRDIAYNDRVSVRGRGMQRGDHTLMLLEGVQIVRKSGKGRPPLGTLEDVLAGPLPMPAVLELSRGRRVQARVIAKEGAGLHIRTSLATMKIPVAEVRGASRLGYGSWCRTSGRRLDFLESLPLRGAALKVFAAAAARVRTNEAEVVSGTVITGVRAGRRLGLIVRTKEAGDFLIFLSGPSKSRRGRAYSTHRQLVNALRLAPGSRIVVQVRRSVHGLRLGNDTRALLVHGHGEPHYPMSPEDPDWRRLDGAKRQYLETLLDRLKGDPSAFATQVLLLDGPSRQIALRFLATAIDENRSWSARVMCRVLENTPPAKVPPEVPAAAIRKLFTAHEDETRAHCAKILGMTGCREGVAALEEAMSLFSSGKFASAATAAIRRIKLTPPR